MQTKELLKRITIDTQIMAGKEFILALLAQGMTIDEMLHEYTTLKREDILACLAFANDALAASTFASRAL